MKGRGVHVIKGNDLRGLDTRATVRIRPGVLIGSNAFKRSAVLLQARRAA
jgi:hypothetical protein